MSDQEEFIGTDIHDEWWKFDQQFAPGGLFAGLPPSKRAELEGNMILRHGERPAPIDPVELLHQQVDHQYEVAGTEVDPGMADMLDNLMDATPDDQIPTLTEQTIRDLGMRALPDLVTLGGYGQSIIKNGHEAEVMAAGRHWLEQGQEAAMRVVGPSLESDAERADFRRRIATQPQGLRYLASVDQQRQRHAAAKARLPARRAR